VEADFAGEGAIFGKVGVARDFGAFVAALEDEMRPGWPIRAVEADLDGAEFDVGPPSRSSWMWPGPSMSA
jgi:hypothetical protein